MDVEQKTNEQRIIFVTGSNKGIGFGIIEGLLKQEDSNDIIILSSRNEDLGKESLQKLIDTYPNKEKNLHYCKLDITNSSSIDNVADFIKNTFGQIDILVNNAGVADREKFFNVDIDDFEYIFPTNVYGNMNITEKLLEEDLINKKGKVVIIGSSYGDLQRMPSEDIKNEFKKEDVTVEDLLNIAKRYREAIVNNTLEQDGWCKEAYSVSKMIINTYASVLARRQVVVDKMLQIYTCCPGWCKTDMAGPNATRTVEEGVVTPIYLINLPHEVNEEFQGKFFYDSKVKSFGI
jgi:NAD(P)-dependent dehydrogenase (short-subunit alcohol dehydrogenase family)